MGGQRFACVTACGSVSRKETTEQERKRAHREPPTSTNKSELFDSHTHTHTTRERKSTRLSRTRGGSPLQLAASRPGRAQQQRLMGRHNWSLELTEGPSDLPKPPGYSEQHALESSESVVAARKVDQMQLKLKVCGNQRALTYLWKLGALCCALFRVLWFLFLRRSHAVFIHAKRCPPIAHGAASHASCGDLQ